MSKWIFMMLVDYEISGKSIVKKWITVLEDYLDCVLGVLFKKGFGNWDYVVIIGDLFIFKWLSIDK